MERDGPTLRATAFWFLRHGQTDWNRDNLAQGSVDVALNQTGLDQARAAAQLLTGRGIAAVVCSPLARARVTADIVAAQLQLPIQIDHGLHEAAFGVMEGQPMLAQWFTDWIDGTSTPAGAESFTDVRDRAVSTLNAILSATQQPTLVIAHGAFFRGLRAGMGLRANDRLPNATPQFCAPGSPWTLTAPG